MSTYEWSHPVHIRELEDIKTFTLAANADQCKALALRAGIPAIHEIAAVVTVDAKRLPGRYETTGLVRGRVDYTCIRTGQVFTAEVEGDIEGVFADKGETVSFARAKKKRAEEFGDEPNFLDEVEDPESLEEGGYIDLGELAAQNFMLALDPYPVAPDAPAPEETSAADPVQVENPFAILGQLRNFMADEDN